MRLVLLLSVAIVQAVPPDILRKFAVHLNAITDVNLTSSTEFQVLEEILVRVADKISQMGVYNETVQWAGGVVPAETKDCFAAMAKLATSLTCKWKPEDDGSCREELPMDLMKLVDSWPKLPSGILRRGPFFFLGDYDQCAELARSETPVHYCTADMQVEISKKTLPLATGLCLPRGCDAPVIRALLDYAMELTPSEMREDGPLAVKEIRCQKTEFGWWNKLFLGVAILLVVCLLSAGTYLDNRRRKKLARKTTAMDYFEEEADEGLEDEEEKGDNERPPIFNAPSIALTYRSAPDLKRTLISKATVGDILCAFSIRISLNHLFRNSAREVSVLHGIKVLSALWVILGHCCLFSVMYMDTVLSFASGSISPWLSSLLFNSSLAVDSFLLISGIVLAFTIRKRILFRGEREGSHHPVYRLLLFYVHRAARLWPALILFSIFMSLFYLPLGDGPMWNEDGIFGAKCTLPEVISHLTFVSNFTPSECLPWLWHISLDFQLYLISPFFLFFLAKKSKVLYIGAGVVVVASLLYRVAMYLYFNLPTNIFLSMLKDHRIEEGQVAFTMLYASPFSRCPPFAIGLATGWFICRRTRKQPSWWAIVGAKLLAYTLLVYSLFAPFSDEGPASIVHAALHRTLWSLGLALIVWLVENNHHPVVQYILSSPKLLPISRLSFGIYLTHEPILLWLIWTQRQPSSAVFFSHFVLLAVTVSALSIVAAFFFAVCFELPMLNIERCLFKKTDCRFNRATEKPRLRRMQRRLGRGAAVLNFSEKTTLWLENMDEPYRNMVERMEEDDEGRPDEEESLRSVSSMSYERLLDDVALLSRQRSEDDYGNESDA